MSLQKLPKIEYHRHLDGSLRFDTIVELAKKNNLDLGAEADLRKKVVITRPFKTLQEVLDCFWTMQKVMVNYESLKRIAYENVEDSFLDGCVLSELRFAPTFIAKGKNLGLDEIYEGIIDGVHEAMKKYPIQVGLIHIMPRSLPLEENIKSTDACLKYAKSSHPGADRLIAFDLADGETEESFKDYSPLIKKAADAGLGITIHSGEDTSPAHMWKTLEVFKAKRIGHGIQAIHDKDLMKELIEREICLELCPTSNWLTGQVPSTSAHPFKKFFDAGVPVSLNSDDPHLMGITLMREYEIARDELGMTVEELHRMNKNALKHTFLNPDIRKTVERHF